MRRFKAVAVLFVAPFTAIVSVAIARSPTLAPTVEERPRPSERLAPAYAALRLLQFADAAQLLADMGTNADAQYLLGLMYENGIGMPTDRQRAHALLVSAAERGSGAAAFVLAAELARDADAAPDASRQMLQRSAQLGYRRAVDWLNTGRPLWSADAAGISSQELLVAWTLDCARKNRSVELLRLGPESARLRDDFGRTALHYAAQAGNSEATAALLELGAEPNATDAQGVTPLMAGATALRPDAVRILLAHGAQSQAFDVEQRTAAFYAARADRVATLRLLSGTGDDFAQRDVRGYNALDVALATRSDAAATLLRSHGLQATVTAAVTGRRNGMIDPSHPGEVYRGWSPLALALARDDGDDVRQLLAAGADANGTTPQGESMLGVAANARALQCLALLTSRGANAAVAGASGHGVLWLAAVRADLPLVRALLAAGVSPDARAGSEEPPLIVATRAEHTAVASALMEAGADLNAVDSAGRTALMIAAASRQRSVLDAILLHHVNPNIQDLRGRSALWYAAAAGSADETAVLLSSGAKASLADSVGLAPLHAAAAQANLRIVNLLVEAHAPINGRDGDGNTALTIAAANGRAQAVHALLTNGAAMNLQNDAGDTALIAASRAGYEDVCQLLLKAGANPSLRNRAGVAAADMAASRGFQKLANEISGRI